MHKWAKSIMECVKNKVESIGLDNMDESNLCELEKWSCIAEKIAEYDYYYHITEAMEKPENQYGKNYDENGKYYTPRMYRMRDMDIPDGRMYYTDMHMRGYDNDGIIGNGSYDSRDMGNRGYSEDYNDNNRRNYNESRFERARRGYEESKMMNPSAEHTEKIEEMFSELETEIKELKPKMSQSEKNMARNKLTNIANTIM